MEPRFCPVSMATANKSRKSAELSPLEEDNSHALKQLGVQTDCQGENTAAAAEMMKLVKKVLIE